MTELGQKPTWNGCPLLADCVEKLENRGASKISQMSHVGDSANARLRKTDTSVSGCFCGDWCGPSHQSEWGAPAAL